MASLIDLTGKVYGRWVVLSKDSPDGHGRPRWKCCCTCGTIKVVMGHHLRNGKSTSCGCFRREYATGQVIHGYARRGAARHPLYDTWRHMHSRCFNLASSSWRWYGARGIAVCDRWLGPEGFDNFLADMGVRPEGRTLDRIDNDGNYEPGNCRWSTPKEQTANRRVSRAA